MKVGVQKIERTNMTEELSGVTVVIIIGLGVLTIVLLFIFGKRQIMRFALRSRRGPHVPLGHNAKKVLKREIERRIDAIPKILTEPKLTQSDPRYIVQPGQQIPVHYYRLKAVDSVKMLENEIKQQDSCLTRHPSENLRAYLLTTLAAPLNGSGQRLIHQFCDLYEHARHDPSYFGEEEFKAYNRLLLKLVDAYIYREEGGPKNPQKCLTAKLLKSTNNSRKSSPNRTPQKQKLQEKNRNLLDPSRLRPLPGLLLANNDEILCVSSVERTDARPTSLIVPLTDNETSV